MSESLGWGTQEEQEGGTERGIRKIKREKSDRESRGNGLSGRDRKGGRIIRNLAKTGRNKLREWSDVRKTTKRICLSLPLRSGCKK